MKIDAIIKSEGMKILIEKLGRVDAERFITLMLKEQFDYTKWQQNIMEGQSVKEISENAMNYRRNQ